MARVRDYPGGLTAGLFHRHGLGNYPSRAGLDRIRNLVEMDALLGGAKVPPRLNQHRQVLV